MLHWFRRSRESAQAAASQLDSAARVSSNVLTTIQGEYAVVLEYERGQYYGLNASATLVWQSLRQGRPLPLIVDQICSEFVVSREIAERDVKTLLADLRLRGLI